MKHEQIRAQWRRASRSLGAAEILLREEFWDDAVSRAYYAVMHAAKAALLLHDAVPKSHSAVRRLFGGLLVHTGEIEDEWAEILAHEQTQRAVADYLADTEPTAEEAREMVRDADRFVKRMGEYLTSNDVDLENE
ncbi:MAG: HEPN domain-containing protein [bacterium]